MKFHFFWDHDIETTRLRVPDHGNLYQDLCNNLKYRIPVVFLHGNVSYCPSNVTKSFGQIQFDHLSFCQQETRHKVTNPTETCECRSKSYCEPLKSFVRQCIWNNPGTWVGQHSKLPHGYQRLYSPSPIHRAELIIRAFQKLNLFLQPLRPLSPTTPTWTCKFYQSFFWI